MVSYKACKLVTPRLLVTVLLLSLISWWTYETPSRTAIHNRILRIVLQGSVDESAFDRFFTGNKVSKFMADYKSNCRSGRFLFAGHLGTTHSNVGFGSYINTAANYYVVVDEENNRRKYQFQFVMYNWIYESLETFFDDFARDTPCPLFRNLNSSQFESLKRSGSYVLTYNNGSLSTSINGSVIALHPHMYWERRRELDKLCQRLGAELFFSKKSALMKSLWQPKPYLKDLMRTLWRNILDNQQRFFAVHIRRGSKISGPYAEAKEVPVERFVTKVREICGRLGPNCPKSVYVMHDEEWVFPKFLALLNNSVQVYNFWTLLHRSNVSWDENMISGFGYDPGSVVAAPRSGSKGWLWRTKQIIIETTMLSLSDELICTYSSNICRLAALLRENHTSNIYSLDQPQWDPW